MKNCINASVFCAALVAFVTLAELNASESVSVTTRATKVCQIVGDWDKHFNAPTINLTEQLYNLKKTDLGVPFSHNGRTYIVFGDTWTAPVDDDPIAFSYDTNLEDGLSLTFLQKPDGSYLPVQIPGISLGSFEVPMEGVSANGKMYVYATTDHTPEVPMGRSVIAVSENDGYTFSYLYDFSSQHFINLSIVKVDLNDWHGFPESSGEGLVIFGSGQYRQSNVRLAVQRADHIESPAARHYFSGLSAAGEPMWSCSESDAAALFDQPYVGELSVSYNKFIRKWIMLFNSEQPRGINMRTADRPWGPWSSPQVIFEPWEDDGYCYFIHTSWVFWNCDSVFDIGREYEWGGEYGPYQFEDHASGNSCSTTIYFTMSTWNPYTVVLMKAALERTYDNQCLLTDYNNNNKTDLADFAKFAHYWTSEDVAGDLSPQCGDGIVDHLDLQEFCDCWLTEY